MNPSIIVAVTIACGIAGGYGRHIQGGAPGTKRWEAMALYAICCVPAFYVYAPDWWMGTGLAVALTAVFYINATLGQVFSNLWLGAARYCLVFPVLFGITGCWEALLFMPPVFLVLKWAKSATDPADPHMMFEEVLGFCTGAAFGMAPLLRGW